MFERNRIDRAGDSSRASSDVEITLESGETISGRLHFPSTRTLGDELNSASSYLDFESHSHERYFVSKQSVQLVQPRHIPRADHLNRAQNKPDTFNPWAVLGVPETASKDDIRDAYHRMVKQYHPDRFATISMPAEIADYINAMSRRINSAHSALIGGIKNEAAPSTRSNA